MVIPKFERITEVDEQKIQSIQSFDCGENSLNRYLKEEALEEAKEGNTKTFLIFIENELIGYFSLISDRVQVIKSSSLHGQINGEKRFARTGTEHIPAVQIRHFAIQKEHQKKGYGTVFLDYALLIIRTFILPYMGATLVTIYSLKSSIGFYEKYGFKKAGDQRKDNVNSCMAIHTDALFDKKLVEQQ